MAEIDTSALLGLVTTIGLNIVLQSMLHFALCVTCLKREPMGVPEEMPFLERVLEIGRDRNHSRSMWVVLLAFTTRLKRSTTYLLRPTLKFIMLL